MGIWTWLWESKLLEHIHRDTAIKDRLIITLFSCKGVSDCDVRALFGNLIQLFLDKNVSCCLVCVEELDIT